MESAEYDCTLDLPANVFHTLNRQKKFYYRILSELKRERFDLVDRLICDFSLDDLKTFMNGKGCLFLVNWAIMRCVPLSVVKYWSKIIPRDLIIEKLKERDYFGIRALVRILENKYSKHSSIYQDYARQKLKFLTEFGDKEIVKFIKDMTSHLILEDLSTDLLD